MMTMMMTVEITATEVGWRQAYSTIWAFRWTDLPAPQILLMKYGKSYDDADAVNDDDAAAAADDDDVDDDDDDDYQDQGDNRVEPCHLGSQIVAGKQVPAPHILLLLQSCLTTGQGSYYIYHRVQCVVSLKFYNCALHWQSNMLHSNVSRQKLALCELLGAWHMSHKHKHY